MIDAYQLRTLIVRPALKAIELHSEAAENLVMGTAAQESELTYVKQLGGGPALGLFQMEPTTYYDIWDNYLSRRPQLSVMVMRAVDAPSRPVADRMVWDLRFASIMCRLHYRRVPEALPEADDIQALAWYWKKFYNTALGKGKPEQFIVNYRRVD